MREDQPVGKEVLFKPKGVFSGYGTETFLTRSRRYEVAKDAIFLAFDFKETVSLRTILEFFDASQGFGDF